MSNVEEMKYLQQKLEQNPNSFLFARLADNLLEAGQVEKAVQICTAGLQQHPNYSTALFVLAKSYMLVNNFDEAEKSLKKVLKIDPDFLSAYKLYAEILLKLGWKKEAKQTLESLMLQDPLDENINDEIEKLTSDIETGVEQQTGDPELVIPKFDTGPQESELTDEAIESLFEPDSVEEMEKVELGESNVYGRDELGKTGQEMHDEDFEAKIDTSEPKIVFPKVEQEADDTSLDESNVIHEDEVIVQDDNSPELDISSDDFDEEEARFSDILDDIFSPGEEADTPIEESLDSVPDEQVDEYDEIDSLAQSDTSITPGELALDEPIVERDLNEETSSTDDRTEPKIFVGGKELGSESESPETEPEPEVDLSEQVDIIEPTLDMPEPDLTLELEDIADEIPEPEEQAEVDLSAQVEVDIVEPSAEELSDSAEDVLDLDLDDEVDLTAQVDVVEPEANSTDDDEDDDFLNVDLDDNLDISEQVDLDDDDSSLLEELKVDDDTKATSKDNDTIDSDELDDFANQETELSDLLGGIDDMVMEDGEELEPVQASAEQVADAYQELAGAPPAAEPKAESDEDVFEQNSEDKTKDKFVTPTLGEIYAAQGQYAKAINVFEILLKKNPENEWYQSKLEYLRKRLHEENS